MEGSALGWGESMMGAGIRVVWGVVNVCWGRVGGMGCAKSGRAVVDASVCPSCYVQGIKCRVGTSTMCRRDREGEGVSRQHGEWWVIYVRVATPGDGDGDGDLADTGNGEWKPQRTNTDRDWKSRRMDAKERNAIVSALVHLNTNTKQRTNKERERLTLTLRLTLSLTLCCAGRGVGPRA